MEQIIILILLILFCLYFNIDIKKIIILNKLLAFIIFIVSYKQQLNKPVSNNYKKNKRRVSESKKKYIAANQQWCCNICYQLLNATYEIDHILPLYLGGDNSINNLQALCRNCHGVKTLKDRL